MSDHPGPSTPPADEPPQRPAGSGGRDLSKTLADLGASAGRAAQQAATKAGDLAGSRRDQVDGWLGKAGEQIDKRTGGKYHDQVAKARSAALAGVDKVAEQGEGGARPRLDDPDMPPPPTSGPPSNDPPPPPAGGTPR